MIYYMQYIIRVHARSAVYRLTIKHNAALTLKQTVYLSHILTTEICFVPYKCSNAQHPSVYIVSYAEGMSAPELQQVQVLIGCLL